MTNFYVLEPDGGLLFGTKWAYADQVDPVQLGESKKCPRCGGAVSLLRWLPPHRIKLSSAKPEKWGDFLWGAGIDLMVSNRFKTIYEAEGLTGITMFYPPAEIVRVGRRKTGDLPSPLPEYHLIEIIWNGANLDDEASQAIRKEAKCEFHRGAVESLEHIVIEPGSWTGVDIFEARGLPGRVVVSERLKQVIEAYKLKNAWLIPAGKYAYDEHRPRLWYVRE